mmetsp:Transcript_15456/g.35305  ORF Transcript_15456/g.35305 Transcript_15456/m.35305 type:complete len:394 (+) Transcript_15456:163-1344(+)
MFVYDWLFGDAEPDEVDPGKDTTKNSELPGLSKSMAPEGNVLMYEVSADPPVPYPQHMPLRQPRRTTEVKLNSSVAVPMQNEMFEGQVVFLHRHPEASASYPYRDYFEGKSRQWEFRLQGRFLHMPRGTLWGGVVLQDFDYTCEPSLFSQALAGVGTPFLRATCGTGLRFSWGARGEERHESSELAHLVGKIASFDQVIVTEDGYDPPNICGDLVRHGFRRNAMSMEEYDRVIHEIMENLNVTRTYTFCFWAPSRFTNLMTGYMEGVLPFGASVNMGTFMEGFPWHFCIYDLESTTGDDEKHLEAHKRYVCDLLIWNSAMGYHESLPHRYYFGTDIFNTWEKSRFRRLCNFASIVRASMQCWPWLPCCADICGGKKGRASGTTSPTRNGSDPS